MKQAVTLPPVIEREYGGYHAKICFATQDVPDAEKNLLDSIMQAYRVRIEQQMDTAVLYTYYNVKEKQISDLY